MKLEIGKTCDFAPGSTPEEPRLVVRREPISERDEIMELVRRYGQSRAFWNDGAAQWDSIMSAIDALQERVARAEADTKRIDHLDAQRKWGDCFTIQVMDSGDFYVRPWRYANQSLLNGSGDPLGATYTAYQTIREAIDASLSAKAGDV